MQLFYIYFKMTQNFFSCIRSQLPVFLLCIKNRRLSAVATTGCDDQGILHHYFVNDYKRI